MNAAYQKHCLTAPIWPSALFGSAFTALSVVQGAPATPHLAALNIGGIYLYNALQCPMVAIQGRESAAHNVVAAGLLGYIGTQSFGLAVPLVDETFFWRNPQFSRPLVAAGVYGSIGAAFAMMGGKQF